MRNTGILCDGLRAIDMDVDDADHVAELRNLANLHLGPAPMRWRHNSNRCLLLYRAEEGEPLKVVHEGINHDPEGASSRIEVLGRGQQFVAFGTHQSGAEIEWWDELSPGQFCRDDLPAVTENQISAFLRAAETVIGTKASALPTMDQMGAQAPKAPGGATDPNFPAPTLDQARECLAAIPAASDYDTWLRVGAAVAHVDSGHAGFSLWNEWSRGAGNYEAGACQSKWSECCKMDRIRFGTLVAMSRQAIGDLSWTPTRPTTPALSATSGLESGRPSSKPNGKGIRILSAAEAASLPPPEWLIPEVMQRDTLATIFGPPASLKSFLALHIANTIAYGLVWRGTPIKQERVAYIAAEGASAVGALRNEAWRIANKLDVRRSKLDLIPHAVMLNDPDQVGSLIEALQDRHHGEPYGLVVVDTMARCTVGADEQSAREMGLVIEACARIKDALRCTVLLIHHSGKDMSKGQRGSSALKGNVDMEAMVTRETGSRDVSLTIRKMKDGPDGHTLRFTTWLQHVKDVDDGDPLSSLVIRDADGTAHGVATTSQVRATRRDIADAITPGTVYSLRALAVAMGKKPGGSFSNSVRAALPDDEADAVHVLRKDGREVRMWWGPDPAGGKSPVLHTRPVDGDVT
jgi:hypothetical protein